MRYVIVAAVAFALVLLVGGRHGDERGWRMRHHGYLESRGRRGWPSTDTFEIANDRTTTRRATIHLAEKCTPDDAPLLVVTDAHEQQLFYGHTCDPLDYELVGGGKLEVSLTGRRVGYVLVLSLD